MDCENNLIMFKAIAHLQVNFIVSVLSYPILYDH